jgi:hypothetical protein
MFKIIQQATINMGSWYSVGSAEGRKFRLPPGPGVCSTTISWILNPRSWIQSPGATLLDPGSWIQVFQWYLVPDFPVSRLHWVPGYTLAFGFPVNKSRNVPVRFQWTYQNSTSTKIWIAWYSAGTAEGSKFRLPPGPGVCSTTCHLQNQDGKLWII